MKSAEVIEILKELGSDSYKRILMNHGAKDPVFGVKISELKKIEKLCRHDYPLSLELFESGIYDAQYLAGLSTDDSKMTKRDLQRWLTIANCSAIRSSVVAWVAAESKHGWDLSLKWIESAKEETAQTGWTTMSSFVAITNDNDLEIDAIRSLVHQVSKTIHERPNLVRYAMNSFIIACGVFVSELTDEARNAANKIGVVTVDMGNTACEVPNALEQIEKAKKKGVIGRKRKTAKC